LSSWDAVLGPLGSRCRGFREETFEVLRGHECRSFGAEVSASFGMSGAEALESRCRRLFRVLGALSFLESWCGRLHWGSRCHGFFGAWGPKALFVRRSRGSKSNIREGSGARAGQRSRRRER
jgi:hypothetical protein